VRERRVWREARYGRREVKTGVDWPRTVSAVKRLEVAVSRRQIESGVCPGVWTTRSEMVGVVMIYDDTQEKLGDQRHISSVDWVQAYLICYQSMQPFPLERPRRQTSLNPFVCLLIRPFPDPRLRPTGLLEHAKHACESSPVVLVFMGDDDVRDCIILAQAGRKEWEVGRLALACVDKEVRGCGADEVGVGACKEMGQA
jgi:hypothetical protein